MKSIFIKHKYFISIFLCALFAANPAICSRTNVSYLAPPGAHNTLRFSIKKDLFSEVFPERALLSEPEVTMISYLKGVFYTSSVDIRNTDLFQYSSSLIKEYPAKIDSIIQLLGPSSYDHFDSFSGDRSRSPIAILKLYLKMFAVIETRKIEIENYTAGKDSFSDFTDELYWIIVERFSRSEAGFAATFFTNLGSREDKPDNENSLINLLPIDQLNYYSLQIADLNIEKIVEKYIEIPELIFYQLLRKLSRLSESFLKKTLSNYNLSTERDMAECLNKFEINCPEVKLSEIIMEYKKLLANIVHVFPDAENIFEYSPHLMLNVFMAYIERNEWRKLLYEKPDNFYYEFERPWDDLTALLEQYLINRIQIPASDRVRDWRKNDFSSTLANAEVIDVDFFRNNERLGFMLKLYAFYYGNIKALHPHESHDQILLRLAEKLNIPAAGNIPATSPVSHDIPPAKHDGQPVSIAEEVKEIVSGLNQRLKKQINIISYIRDSFEKLYFERITRNKANLIYDGPVVINKGPISSIPINTLQHIILSEFEKILREKKETDGFPDFDNELKKCLVLINDKLSQYEKFNLSVNLDIIPAYAEISAITEKMWDELFKKYLNIKPPARITHDRQPDIPQSF